MTTDRLCFLLACSLLAACGGDNIRGIYVSTPTAAPIDEVENEPAGARTFADPLIVDPIATPERLTVAALPPRCLPQGPTCYPILLAHGFMANPEFLEFFAVADHLRALGYTVVEGAVEPFDGVEVRGAMLADQIEQAVVEYDVDKINVIAQSMGGLDARYAISTTGVGTRVATLITVSTPHRGSAAADSFLGEGLLGDSPIVDGVLIALGTQYSEGLAEDPQLRAGLESLSEAAAPAFNAANEDVPGVVYESWAGLSNMFGWSRPTDDEVCESTFWNDNGANDDMDPVFYATAPLVAHGADRLPNDGMVTVESAKWGTFRGCLRADHADEVGQIEDTTPDPSTGFAHLEFYEFLANDLATRGF